MTETVSIVGLGKLGSPMGAAIASRGYDVIGVDTNPTMVEAINAHRPPILEPDLPELLTAHGERFRATTDIREAVEASTITFVIVPTPSDERGAFSIDYAAIAFEQIGAALRDLDRYHLIVLTSTVLPGATRHGLLPRLERASGRLAGRDFGVCYSPEFIALGSVIQDFLSPDMMLIGEHDDRAGQQLADWYAAMLPQEVPMARMSLENAELAKISINSYVTTKISFANTLAAMCEALPGGDIDVVSDALGLDRRIGRPYLTGGLGYGGTCFPRDTVAFRFLAGELSAAAPIADATDAANLIGWQRVVEMVERHSAPGGRIAVLGLAFKPGTNVIEQSQGLGIALALAERGYAVHAHDPLATEAVAASGDAAQALTLHESVDSCVQAADVVVVTTPDPAFSDLSAERLGAGAQHTVVVDCWRLLAHLAGEAGITYVAIGREQDPAAESRLQTLWGTTAD